MHRSTAESPKTNIAPVAVLLAALAFVLWMTSISGQSASIYGGPAGPAAVPTSAYAVASQRGGGAAGG